MRNSRLLVVAVLALAGSACGGGSDGGSGPTTTAVLTSLVVSPTAANVEVGSTQNITAQPRDQNGGTLSGISVAFTSSNPAVASVNASTGIVTGVTVGTATITATATSGGITKTATTAVTVVAAGPAPLTATVTMGLQDFTPSTVRLARGGTVTYINNSGVDHNVTFANASAVSGGNIDTPARGSFTRTFNTAGTFNYTCTIHAGMNGTVIVQ